MYLAVWVGQGAMIAMAMVLIQKNEALEPKVVAFRKKLEKTIADKHEETLCKMGAILASGILDAGGRNVTISLRSRTGFNRMTAILGLLGFIQFWYWYPLVYFLSLTFKATAFIGLNDELKMPKFEIECKNKASLFAYPPPVTKEEHGPTKKVASAVLSTTAKAKQRAKEKVKMQANGEMDVDVRKLLIWFQSASRSSRIMYDKSDSLPLLLLMPGNVCRKIIIMLVRLKPMVISNKSKKIRPSQNLKAIAYPTPREYF